MTKRNEKIEEITKGLNPEDRTKLFRFWNGLESLSGDDFKKFKKQIEELSDYEKKAKINEDLEAFLNESRREYRNIDIGARAAANQGEKAPWNI